MKKNIVKLYYWDGMPNFGDALNPIICKKIFGIEVQKSGPEDCDASFIGSLLDDFLSPNLFSCNKESGLPAVQIWGSGFIGPANTIVKRPFNLSERYFRSAEVHAVRGMSSKGRLERIIGRPLENCVVGDPGLLASMLVDVTHIKKKYPLGVIPHHLEIHGYQPRTDSGYDCIEGLIPSRVILDVPHYKRILDSVPGSVLIDMESNPLDCLQRIAECELIVSSALHGLIAADSLGIPNRWITASNRLIGNDYKFRDYYSAFGLDVKPIDIRETALGSGDIDKLHRDYIIDINCVDELKSALIRSFPYKL